MEEVWTPLIDKIRWQEKKLTVIGELIKVNEYKFKDKQGYTFDIKQENNQEVTINGHKLINDYLLRLHVGDKIKIIYNPKNKLGKQEFKLFCIKLTDGSRKL